MTERLRLPWHTPIIIALEGVEIAVKPMILTIIGHRPYDRET